MDYDGNPRSRHIRRTIHVLTLYVLTSNLNTKTGGKSNEQERKPHCSSSDVGENCNP